MDKGDYVFAGGLIAAVSLLFLAVSSYEIPFYAMEENVQFLSAATTIIGIIIVGYGFISKASKKPY